VTAQRDIEQFAQAAAHGAHTSIGIGHGTADVLAIRKRGDAFACRGGRESLFDLSGSGRLLMNCIQAAADMSTVKVDPAEVSGSSAVALLQRVDLSTYR
jgi:hypothetical protein